MAEYLVPVTLHHTILVPYEVDPCDGGFDQAAQLAADDPDLHEMFPRREREKTDAHVDGWWDVDTDPDALLDAYQECKVGREALARGLMALMIQ